MLFAQHGSIFCEVGLGLVSKKVGGVMEWVNLGLMVVWALFLVLILAAMYRLVRRPRPGRRGPAGEEPETPMEILRKRFARGEINREEFQSRKKELEQKSQ